MVALSLDGRAPEYWADAFGKMVRHLADIRASMLDKDGKLTPAFDQFEIVLRANKQKVTAMGPTPFRPDRWETRNTGGGINSDLG